MIERPSAGPLLGASQVLGADALFWQTAKLVASREPGAASLCEPALRERLTAVHEQFARDCATLVERHLGHQQAPSSLAALASAPVQQFLVARSRMAPALAGHLQALRREIAELEL
ncbi:MAG: hypothetical protein RL685_4846 [Pseudomonadota bacterium]|jgi:hypothetical protein